MLADVTTRDGFQLSWKNLSRSQELEYQEMRHGSFRIK
jgi:hypothetical protein